VTTTVAALLLTVAVGAVALVLTVASERRARAARAQAEDNFQLAVDTSVTIGDVGDELAALATADRTAVERIYTRAEQSYSRLAERAPDSPQVADVRARMLVGMARLDMALGRTRRAGQRAADAARLYESLAGRPGDDYQRRVGLAHSRYWLAASQLRQGRSRAALELYELVVATRRQMIAERPGEAARRAELAAVLNDVGDVR